MITFGLVNQEIQSSAYVSSDNLTYFSKSDGVFGSLGDRTIYGTLEKDFTTASGSMYLLPRNEPGKIFLDTGLTSSTMISDGTVAVVIDFGLETSIDYKGLTINFGSNYPTSFDIESGNQTIEVRNNTDSIYQTEEVFEGATDLTITVYSMLKPQTRLRIFNIKFGYGLVFDNDDVLDATLTSYVSPIAENVPQFDFSVRLTNYDKYFNVDNPDSAVNFLETGQEVKVTYGYQLPDSDEIEWVDGAVMYCSQWSSDDNAAVISAQDIFRNMEGEYYKGVVGNISYYELATRVFADAGISEYEIDNSLQTMYTSNPLPRVSHKEALQMISNATRCVLTVDRAGTIKIVPHTEMYGTPVDFRMERLDMLSSPNAIKQELVKDVTVPRYVYQEGGEELTLLSEEITATAGMVQTFYFTDPSYGYRATFNESATNVWFVASGAYYITLKFLIAGTYQLDIYGSKYQIIQSNYREVINSHGKSVLWENPLISDATMASALVSWLGEYYASKIEYEYQTRGNPELDTSDVIYQDNDFVDDMKVILYRQTLGFNGAFSGNVTVRRENDS